MDYQNHLLNQREAYLTLVDCLTRHCSIAAMERAIADLETNAWWREPNPEQADIAAAELRACCENTRDARAGRRREARQTGETVSRVTSW